MTQGDGTEPEEPPGNLTGRYWVIKRNIENKAITKMKSDICGCVNIKNLTPPTSYISLIQAI